MAAYFAEQVFPGVEVNVSWKPEIPPLLVTTSGYMGVLDHWDKDRAAGALEDATPPAFVLDEADVLMEWDDKYKAERQALLRFFVAITKAQRSHVILATSDNSCLTWLSKEIGATDFQSFVVGDFPAQEARLFLDECLQQVGKPAAADDNWEAVHKVCGGNAGALTMATGCYDSLGDWTAALLQISKDVWRTMDPRYWPAPAADAAYTAADYATAVNAILDSAYKAVDGVDLIAVLGQRSLEAMVQAKLFAMRPYSPWAADIDAAACGVDLDATVVTAPTPIHLFLMEHHRDIIMASLDA